MASPTASSRSSKIPEILAVSGGQPLQAVGFGTASFPFVAEDVKNAVLAALELGYRHIDTASVYGSEQVVGEAVAEATRRRVIASRGEVFVTTKVWCTQCHPDLVLPSLKESLQISLRWIYEQGASMVTKSMKKERIEKNMEIFDWELTDEDRFKIAQIPQQKKVTVLAILAPEGVPGVDISEIDVVEV